MLPVLDQAPRRVGPRNPCAWVGFRTESLPLLVIEVTELFGVLLEKDTLGAVLSNCRVSLGSRGGLMNWARLAQTPDKLGLEMDLEGVGSSLAMSGASEVTLSERGGR